ncbi:MAG: KH domain-containing protein [Elusimicrobia bacterium]|nr:KH domain-containing protein [Elusimicrobiota bacterium]MBD3411889.1 KH domain-containing protein [Elusimicrobiota bacterium]
MNEIETQAPTVEEAIRKGLNELAVEKDKVDVRILDEGSSGLFGLMGAKPAIVRLKLKNAAEPSQSTQPEVGEHIIERAQSLTRMMLDRMGIPYAGLTVSLHDNEVLISLESSDSSILIGKQGRTLQSIQFLLGIFLSRHDTGRYHVIVDVNQYRKQYEERLLRIAAQAAQEVVTSQKVKKLDPMPAFDRRLIHTALKDNTDIFTESEGYGSFRSVVVKPKKRTSA